MFYKRSFIFVVNIIGIYGPVVHQNVSASLPISSVVMHQSGKLKHNAKTIVKEI